MFKNQILILFYALIVTVSFVFTSPVFEPSDNLVDDTVLNDNDDGFERSGDAFENMNDFNFEETPPGNQQEANNQSGEQNDEDNGSPHNVRERHVPEINKATAEEEPETGIDDGSNEAARGEGNRETNGRNKQKYADGEENSARSLDFEPFDKESDDANKNEFNEANGSGETNGRMPMMTRPMIGANPSDDENSSAPRNGPPGPGLPMPQLEQIDEPIIVNPGPVIPLAMHGRSTRNSEENGGGNYKSKKQKNKTKKIKNAGAPGSETDQSELKDYKFRPGGIKYLHETSVSKTRVAPHPLASYAVDHSAAVGNLFKFNKNELVNFNPLPL